MSCFLLAPASLPVCFAQHRIAAARQGRVTGGSRLQPCHHCLFLILLVACTLFHITVLCALQVIRSRTGPCGSRETALQPCCHSYSSSSSSRAPSLSNKRAAAKGRIPVQMFRTYVLLMHTRTKCWCCPCLHPYGAAPSHPTSHHPAQSPPPAGLPSLPPTLAAASPASLCCCYHTAA